MADPLARTFDLLTSTRASAAVDLLVVAADSQSAVIREWAIAALLRRGTPRCQMEVIRRLAALSPGGHKLLEDFAPRLSGTLRQCLLHGDTELRTNALSIVGSTECYDQVSTLLQILQQPDDEFQEAACQTLQDLVNRLYEQCHGTGARKPLDRPGKNLPQARQTVLAAVDAACNQFAGLSHGRDVVECGLAIGDPDNFAIRKILLQSPPDCRELAGNLLLASKHPGVMRLAMEFMGQSYPIAKAFEAFEQRTDPEFVFHVLRTFPKRLSENQQKNFKQITRINWIVDELLPLSTIPTGLHESLVHFVQASGIQLDYKIEVQKWLMLHGSVAARLAASEVLEAIAPDSVRTFLTGGLESEDEDVQAWATSQLRTQGVPEAIRILIERLDSPLPAVREAARGELGSFNLELMLNIFEHLDRAIVSRAGRLVQKIDPACSEKLLAELGSSVRRRRIRGARAAEALGLAADVQTGLVAMLRDEDALVRRTAAEVLGCVPGREVIAGLTALSNDSSPRVREAAEQSLEQLRRNDLAASAL